MDIEQLFSRAWKIIWSYKWLILLGVLVVIGTSGFGNPGGNRFQFNRNENDNELREPGGVPSPEEFNPQEFFQNLGQSERTAAAIAIPIVIALCCLIVLVGVALWVISRIASGALIAGVDQIEGVGTSTLRQAWSAGRARGWRLIGIDLIVALPFLTAVLVDLALIVPAVNIANDLDDMSQIFAGGGLLLTAATIFCLGWAVTSVLRIISGLADRACMTENTGVFDSYRRAWAIVTTRFGQVLVLAMIHLVAEFFIGIVLIVPGFWAALCCLLWPVMLALNGAIKAYLMTIWTLAWRDWTGRTRTGEPVAQPAPGV